MSDSPQTIHDPAPSRLSYRIHRWWLTPFYRRALRLGTPLVLSAAAALWFVSDPARVEQVSETAQEARRAIEERPEFMVQAMAIDGASQELAEAVREELTLRLPIWSFDMDLDATRRTVE